MGCAVTTNGVPTYDKWGAQIRQIGCFIRNGVSMRSMTLVLIRSEEHTSELQSLMRISYAVFCLKKKTTTKNRIEHNVYDEKTNILITKHTNNKTIYNSDK